MDILIGSYFGDKKVVKKNIINFRKIENVILKTETDVTNPVFIFDIRNEDSSQPDISVFKDINYVHWYKMDRYYFCKVVFNGVLVEFHCTLDRRKTWQNTILNSNQYVERQENVYNKNLFDSEIPLESKKGSRMYVFPTKVGDSTETSRNYVLTTNGKVSE